jgi:hypothetical protein
MLCVYVFGVFFVFGYFGHDWVSEFVQGGRFNQQRWGQFTATVTLIALAALLWPVVLVVVLLIVLIAAALKA